jgi:hypothetical protein
MTWRRAIDGLLAVSLILLTSACDTRQGEQTARTQRLLDQAPVNDSARVALSDHLFLLRDLPAIYAQLAQPQPDDHLGTTSSRGRLLVALRQLNEAETVAFIEDHYAQWSAAHQALALSVLAHRGDALASQALVRVLIQETSLDPAVLPEVLGPYVEQPERAAYLFPALLDLRLQPGYDRYVFGLLHAALESGGLPPQALQDQLPLLRTSYLKPLSDEARAQLLYGLAFFASDSSIQALLAQVRQQGAPHMRLAATLACLDQGLAVSDSTLYQLAAMPRLRNELFLSLHRREQAARFPAQWYTQSAMAEGDMAAWLAERYPQAGIPEPIGCFEVASDGEWIYAYRFLSDGHWRSGISGPQPGDSTQVRATGYLTGSELEKYWGQGLMEHVRRILVAQDLTGFDLRAGTCR